MENVLWSLTRYDSNKHAHTGQARRKPHLVTRSIVDKQKGTAYKQKTTTNNKSSVAGGCRTQAPIISVSSNISPQDRSNVSATDRTRRIRENRGEKLTQQNSIINLEGFQTNRAFARAGRRSRAVQQGCGEVGVYIRVCLGRFETIKVCWRTPGRGDFERFHEQSIGIREPRTYIPKEQRIPSPRAGKLYLKYSERAKIDIRAKYPQTSASRGHSEFGTNEA